MRNHRPGTRQVIEERRSHVAKLRLRGLSSREIVKALTKLGCLNAKGNPWNHTTVCDDIIALEQRWREESLQDTRLRAAQIDAELNEIKRNAWKQDDMTTLLKAIQQQRDLLGLDLVAEIEAKIKAKQLEQLAEDSTDTPDEPRRFVFEVIDGRKHGSETDTTPGEIPGATS